MKALKQCLECKKYTLKDLCHGTTIVPRPAKYSPEDQYASYRREAKRPQLIARGLL